GGLDSGRPGASGGEALAALGAAAGKDLAAIGGRHAGTEAVVALALEVAGLVGALGGHDGCSSGTQRKEPAILVRAAGPVKCGVHALPRRGVTRPPVRSAAGAMVGWIPPF